MRAVIYDSLKSRPDLNLANGQGAQYVDLPRPERSGRPLLFRKAAMTVQQYWSFSGYKEDRLMLIYTRF